MNKEGSWREWKVVIREGELRERRERVERDGESLSEAVAETEIDQCLDHLSLIS